MNVAKSKNGFSVLLDMDHIREHISETPKGGCFVYKNEELACKEIGKWIGEMTLPPETPLGFPGDYRNGDNPFVVKATFNSDTAIGWNSLVKLRENEEGTKVEWKIRRGYLTKILPEVQAKICHTIALMVGKIDRKKLKHKILSDVNFGYVKSPEDHNYWHWANSPTPWILMTAYPGKIAPAQSDYSFWNHHGFAEGKIEDTSSQSKKENILQDKNDMGKRKIRKKNIGGKSPTHFGEDPKNPIHIDLDDTFEALMGSYEYTQHWISLADTKAGLALTIIGVIAGFMLQQLVYFKKVYLTHSHTSAVFILCTIPFALYFIFQILSFLFTIKVFFPRTLDIDYGKTRHIFNLGIAKCFPKPNDREAFWKEYKKLKEVDLKQEYVYQLHTDALICTIKYKYLRYCIKTTLLSIGCAFLTLIALGVFVK